MTNKEYQTFVNEIGYEPPPHWIEGNIPKGQENQPLVNISYKDAFLYTVWAGRRLPSVEEIHRAAKIEGLLSDADDQLDEWTSTPHIAEPRVDAASGARVGGGNIVGHKVFGNTQPRLMRNKDFNAQTGFRTAYR